MTCTGVGHLGFASSEGQRDLVLYEKGHSQELERNDVSSLLDMSWTTPRHCVLWLGLPSLRYCQTGASPAQGQQHAETGAHAP